MKHILGLILALSSASLWAESYQYYVGNTDKPIIFEDLNNVAILEFLLASRNDASYTEILNKTMVVKQKKIIENLQKFEIYNPNATVDPDWRFGELHSTFVLLPKDQFKLKELKRLIFNEINRDDMTREPYDIDIVAKMADDSDWDENLNNYHQLSDFKSLFFTIKPTNDVKYKIKYDEYRAALRHFNQKIISAETINQKINALELAISCLKA